MSGRAVLAIWDPSAQDVFDVEVTWSRGHDVDARASVPARFEARWREALRVLRRAEVIQPYGGLGIVVEPSKLTSSATGIYATAVEIFGRSARWRVPPPYPETRAVDAEGVVQ